MNDINRINLSQVKKCDQYWLEMEPVKGGRMCSKCDRMIIDFRKSTNKEVALKHAYADAPVCGLYRSCQLKMHEKPVSTYTRFKLKGFYIGLVSLLTSITSAAEGIKPSHNLVSQFEPDYKSQNKPVAYIHNKRESMHSDSLILRGKLTDLDDEPLMYALVIVEGTNFGTTTDEGGNYSLDVTSILDTTATITIMCNYIGYGQKNVTISKSSIVNNPRVDVKLENDENFTVYTIEMRRSFIRRVWSGIKRPFVRH